MHNALPGLQSSDSRGFLVEYVLCSEKTNGYAEIWDMLHFLTNCSCVLSARRNLIFKRNVRRRDRIMALSYLQTSTTHTKPLDLNQKSQSRNHSCFLKSSAATLTVDPADDMLKFDASLQRYKSDVDPLTLITYSLRHAIELLNFQVKEHPLPLIVTSFKAGKKTKIEVRVRDNKTTVQLSTLVHKIEQVDILSTTKSSKKSRYLLLMTMMRFNSLLSRLQFGGRICACTDGRFIFFQDLPVSILNENGMLENKLDDFIITTVGVCLGFGQSSGASNFALKT